MSDDATISQLQHALALHEAGQLEQAEAAYRSVLQSFPDHPDALHLLGVLMNQTNRLAEAQAMIERAITITPQAVFHLNLGNVYHRRGLFAAARHAWRQAAALSVDVAADAYANIAALTRELQAQSVEAELWQRAANMVLTARANPQDAATWSELADVLRKAGEIDVALGAAAAACRLAPRNGHFHNQLGRLFMLKEQPTQAVGAFRTAASILPDNASVMVNLAIALARCSDDLTEAVTTIRHAIKFDAKLPGAYETLAMLMSQIGRAGEAAAAARQAVALAPYWSRAHETLGNALFGVGRVDDAVASFRRAIELDPTRCESLSNMLMVMHYQSGVTPQQLLEEHVRWAQLHADPITERVLRHEAHGNDRDPNRKLRVGYVSPDFRRHPVSLFFAPLLQHHDRDAVDIILYSNTQHPDETTEQFRQASPNWRDIRGVSDDVAAQIVRDDRVDILVDLAGHTAHNRLLLMARKPAPVQATYIGYWNTTGMRAMDYRLTDAWNDPPGLTERFWVEQVERIDGGAWCFTPPSNCPDVNGSPAARSGIVTFISTHKLAKISDQMLTLWRQILERHAKTRLVIITGGDETRVHAALRRIDRARYDLRPRVSIDDYFQLYHTADVLLDVLPHNGHTTGLDALWMGVPVLTVTGEMHCSRLCASLLSSAGLDEFICSAPGQYVDVAVSLCERIDELAQLRSGMRERLLRSNLTNGPRLAREIERAYRKMWRTWCDR